METKVEETKPQPEEPSSTPSEPTPPPEEPIVLNDLFASADRDLDALFPDPSMKRLLKDVIRNRQKNERFLKKITLDVLPPEEDDDQAEPPESE